MPDGVINISTIKRYSISILLTAAVTLVALISAAIILFFTEDPEPLYRTAALISLTVSALISGAISAKVVGGKVQSLIVGTVVSFLLFAISLIFFDGVYGFPLSLVIHAAYVAVFFAGSILISGNNKKRIKKYRKKRK